MDDFGLNKYLEQMNYITFRMNAIDMILNKSSTTSYQYTNIEFMVLQMRKIIEHIAMGNLIANKDLYSEYRNRFFKDWNAKLIFKDIEKLNPNFYPEPIEVDKSGDIDKFIKLPNVYLTQEEAIDIYEKCNGLMHVPNPYGSQPDIIHYENIISTWQKRIRALTNCHIIHMVDGIHKFYIIMQSSQNGRPAGNIFKRVED